MTTKAGELLSMQIQAAGFAECSAMTNDGVERKLDTDRPTIFKIENFK